MNSKKSVDIPIILILAAVLTAHIQLIFNNFHTDDWQILDIMRHGFNWRAFLSMENYSNFRPFANIIIYFRSLIFDNIPALWYMLNIALHLTAVFLLYQFVKTRANKTAAIVAALIFGIYFQHFEAVLWLYGIVRLIAAIMLILTLIFYSRYKQKGITGDIILSYIFFALALFAVEDSLIFAFFFGVGMITSGNIAGSTKRNAGLGYFLVVFIYLALRLPAIGFGNPSTEYFFIGTHAIKNFYAYSIWTIIPQFNHPYLINFISKYSPGIIPYIGTINALVFFVFIAAAIIIIIKGSKLEKGMTAFLLLSLLMPSMLNTKVSTKLMYIPSIAVATIFGSIFNRLWLKFKRSGRTVLIVLLTIYILGQAFAINATIVYYRTTQENVERIVDEIAGLDIDWSRYDYLLLNNLPGRVRPGHFLKYRLGFNIRLIINNEETENLANIEDEVKRLARMGKSFVLIDFGSGKPVVVEKSPRSGPNSQ